MWKSRSWSPIATILLATAGFAALLLPASLAVGQTPQDVVDQVSQTWYQSYLGYPGDRAAIPARADGALLFCALFRPTHFEGDLEVRLVDEPVTTTDEWGIDVAQRFGDLSIGFLRHAPGQGVQGQWQRDGGGQGQPRGRGRGAPGE